MTPENFRRSNEMKKVPHVELTRSEMTSLSEQLHGNLARGEYGTIICDDTSGTIPSVTFSLLTNWINIDLKLPPTSLVMISGTRNKNQLPKMREQLASSLSRIDREKKVLVVTDHILTGESMHNIVSTLVEVGIQGDIASLTSSLPASELSFEYPLFVGKESGSKNTIWGNYELTGKYRSKFSDDRFIGVENVLLADGQVVKGVVRPEAREMVRPALHTARFLADRLYRKDFAPSNAQPLREIFVSPLAFIAGKWSARLEKLKSAEIPF